jgi:hypothetical protein
MLGHVSALMLTIFRELVTLFGCAAYASAYMLGILHTIKIKIIIIIINNIKCFNS